MNALIRIIPLPLFRQIIILRKHFFDGYSTKSYSQEGEDRILQRIFERKTYGFYVDVGAHHPKRFSNTYFFYKNGWRGINIDATPGSMKLFHRLRKNDLNLECAISDSKETLPYYLFEESALNTLSQNLAEEYIAGGQVLLGTKKLKTIPLSEILAKHLPDKTSIDFLSIDAEGFDLHVLQSNDWYKYRPTVLLVESLKFDLTNPDSSDIDLYMVTQGYKLSAKTVNTLFFERID